ncbi:hypothetical protein BO83DRAFT_57097 [Aspergillus eucalypticola CBS 122712]|uniref:Uncharacterized protein n=1 Tax=Aspergillus eucalypticola (strain CBS 122712 / IBT 29274) TaxID=1448314 RepID=A0A317VC05_ASPEC|nr:uncharacterized protein BO83DRAFT_57097 [Aspergillus eucalypticola CBS 122712]PWY70597.1 hypothetical protein BO83DRAFT_57097 [Aspergillus eucalypticola CBS 122712]
MALVPSSIIVPGVHGRHLSTHPSRNSALYMVDSSKTTVSVQIWTPLYSLLAVSLRILQHHLPFSYFLSELQDRFVPGTPRLANHQYRPFIPCTDQLLVAYLVALRGRAAEFVTMIATTDSDPSNLKCTAYGVHGVIFLPINWSIILDLHFIPCSFLACRCSLVGTWLTESNISPDGSCWASRSSRI